MLASAATYDDLSYEANLTITSNNSSLERSESIQPTMSQKRLKYACAKTFRRGLGLKTTRQAYRCFLLLNQKNSVNALSQPSCVNPSINIIDKPDILGYFRVSSL